MVEEFNHINDDAINWKWGLLVAVIFILGVVISEVRLYREAQSSLLQRRDDQITKPDADAGLYFCNPKD